MSNTINSILSFALLVAWLAGIVLAKGFWATLAAATLVFPAWYLVVERLMQAWSLA